MFIMFMPLFTKYNFIKCFDLVLVIFDAGRLQIIDSIKSSVLTLLVGK